MTGLAERTLYRNMWDMPAVSRIKDMSTGHGCFPPTALIQTPVIKTFFNGELAAVVDTGCQHAAHSCGITTHSGSTRSPSTGASKTFIEGKLAARIGDNIACGDAIAEGSPNSFIE
jgi:uncharacterized Zn-binding protein involved in type VI secretion